MSRSTIKCPDITITNGQNASQAIVGAQIHEDSDSILLACNAIDGAQSYKIQVNENPDGSGNWDDLTDGTNLIIPPSVAGKSAIYPSLGYTFRIVTQSGGNVASTCTWKMFKSVMSI